MSRRVGRESKHPERGREEDAGKTLLAMGGLCEERCNRVVRGDWEWRRLVERAEYE